MIITYTWEQADLEAGISVFSKNDKKAYILMKDERGRDLWYLICQNSVVDLGSSRSASAFLSDEGFTPK